MTFPRFWFGSSLRVCMSGGGRRLACFLHMLKTLCLTKAYSAPVFCLVLYFHFYVCNLIVDLSRNLGV